MSNVIISENTLYGIGDAIRNKNNTQTPYKPSQMAGAIDALPIGYPEPTGSISITQNGSANVKDYATAVVNVPNSYDASDEGKVVDNGALVAQTSQTVTQNGTYDTTTNDEVVVNVASGGTLVTKTITANGTYDPADDNADGYSSVTVNVPSNVAPYPNFVANWDFSNPYNSRGASSYSDTSGSETNAINGWLVYKASIELETNGIRMSHTTSNDGYFHYRLNSSLCSKIIGKTITISLMVDDTIGSTTFSISSSSGYLGGIGVNGVILYMYGFGSSNIHLYIGGSPNNYQNHIIKAVKLEIANEQTLASQIGGVWSVNERTNHDSVIANLSAYSYYN